MPENKKNKTQKYQSTYTTLANEDDYSCGSKCTCKFLKNRTPFDRILYNFWSSENKDLYENYRHRYYNELRTFK